MKLRLAGHVCYNLIRCFSQHLSLLARAFFIKIETDRGEFYGCKTRMLYLYLFCSDEVVHGRQAETAASGTFS